MLILLLAVLQKAPILTESASRSLGPERHCGLAVSRTGRFVLLTEADRLVICNPTSLDVIKEIPARWTTFGFDAADDVLLVVGEKVVRYDTREWKAADFGTLEGAKFEEERSTDAKPDQPKPLKLQQALVTEDLEIYYCSVSGDIAVASHESGTLKSRLMGFTWAPELGPPQRILAFTDTAFLVSLGMPSGVVLRGTVHLLTRCPQAIGATTIGNVAVCVGRDSEAIYTTRTWATLASRDDLKNSCVAFDRKSGWVFIGDGEGLRGWSTETFHAPIRFPHWKKAVTAVGVSAEKQALYTISEGTLRRWKVSPQ